MAAKEQKSMIVFTDPSHRLHDPVEPHRFGGTLLPPAEIAERADRILSGLEGAADFESRLPPPVDRALLLEVHTERYLTFLETAHDRWLELTGSPHDAEAAAFIRPLPDTPWREPVSVLAEMGRYSNDVDPILSGTWQAALGAAACASAAAGAVIDGERSAYALSRPPGHHAAPEVYGGYCFINNGAVAASRLVLAGMRVAIVDIDTHHGNGTQTVFWERGDVLTASIHGDPTEHFPFFLGHADETGSGDGAGANLNLPLPTGTTWPEYSEALDAACAAVRDHKADAIVVALGVDTHVSHGVLGLESDDYPRLGAALASLDLPTVFVQEGGYEPGVLERAVPGVLTGFLDVA
jgi:acetoin utilization deacetylase AcuC-like enzyme